MYNKLLFTFSKIHHAAYLYDVFLLKVERSSYITLSLKYCFERLNNDLGLIIISLRPNWSAFLLSDLYSWYASLGNQLLSESDRLWVVSEPNRRNLMTSNLGQSLFLGSSCILINKRVFPILASDYFLPRVHVCKWMVATFEWKRNNIICFTTIKKY